MAFPKYGGFRSPRPLFDSHHSWKDDVVDLLLDPDVNDQEGIKLLEDTVEAVNLASEKLELLKEHIAKLIDKKESQIRLQQPNWSGYPEYENPWPETRLNSNEIPGPENNDNKKRKNDNREQAQKRQKGNCEDKNQKTNFPKDMKTKKNQGKTHAVSFCIYDPSVRVQNLIDGVQAIGIEKSQFEAKKIQFQKNRTRGLFIFKNYDDFEVNIPNAKHFNYNFFQKILQHRCSLVFNGKTMDLRPSNL